MRSRSGGTRDSVPACRVKSRADYSKGLYYSYGQPQHLFSIGSIGRCRTAFRSFDVPTGWQSFSNGKTLGGHLKTGHRWTLQNRPMEQNQNKIIYNLG
jgi:hypothetical protein